MANIGLFGGSFDPPTLGHAAVIESVLQGGHIDELWLVPAGDDRYDRCPIACASERVVMLELMVAEYFAEAKIRICRDQIAGGLPSGSATIDLVRLITKRQPLDSFFWIVGADNLPGVPHWREFPELIARIQFLVVPRPGTELGTTLPAWANSVAPSPHNRFSAAHGASSTEVRKRLRDPVHPDTLAALIAPSVLAHIQSAHLYADSPG